MVKLTAPASSYSKAPASAVTTTDSNYHFIISQPGSYYLTANIAATKTNAIEINVAGVMLDLNGFRISRASGTGGNGIEIAVTAHGVSIRNGGRWFRERDFFPGQVAMFWLKELPCRNHPTIL